MKNFTISLFLFLACFPLWAQGNLLLHPKRVVFTASQDRVQTISLTNTGTDSATYRISFSQIRMKENGQMQEIVRADSGQNFADAYLRLYPKNITIAPNKSQLVKLQLVKSGQLEDGEYRSHLVFRAIPKETKKSITAEKPGNKELKIEIKPVFGYGIPVIIHKGSPDTKVNISHLKLSEKENEKYLSFSINCKGKISPYGDIKVIHTSKDGRKNEVALLKGISVYIPLTKREFEFKLKPEKGIDLSQGNLKIIYTMNGLSSEIYDEKILDLQV